MLVELRVENLVLIERAELRLGPGLVVVTGETGAGKTVLAHAIDLLLGGRLRGGVVRPGPAEAYVEGIFRPPAGLLDDPAFAELRERLPAGEEELVLGRRVGADGRTRAFLQGRSAAAADLHTLGSRLLAFYGQHEHRKLTVASAQLELLDAFCGPDHLATREAFAACHARVLALRRELEAARARTGSRDRDRDLLAFELAEIDALAPDAEDERRLLAERERLRALDALRAGAGAAAEALAPESGEPGGAAALAEAERLAAAAAGVDPALDALAERLVALRVEADDVAAELRRYLADLEAEPGRLDAVEERLELYERLKRKHGGSIDAVLAHAERCRSELDRLDHAGEALDEAERALAGAAEREDELATDLTTARHEAAPRLAAAVVDELAGLALGGATFEVRLEPRDRGPLGDERAELLIAPNPGVPLAPLRETASGGELARVMLALMSVASAGGPRAPETLVFDEVDAGIGGQTARAVGERLRRLAGGRQVVCITHLPQIASLAAQHFRIEKEATGEVARTTVEPLEAPQVVEELCRMLGADSADAGARRHAEELLAAA